MDLDSGDRTILSDNAGVGAGPAFVFPLDVVVDWANDRAGVLDQGVGLVGVDSGHRRQNHSLRWRDWKWSRYGPIPQPLEIDIPNDVGLCTGPGPGSALSIVVYSVDLATGDRTVVSNNSGIGVGPNMNFLERYKTRCSE